MARTVTTFCGIMLLAVLITAAAWTEGVAPAFFLPGPLLAAAQPFGCVRNYSPSVNYFPNAFKAPADNFVFPIGRTPNSAGLTFTVQYARSYKIVRNIYGGLTYVLYQCGTPRPAASSFPAGTRFVSIPISNIGLDSTVPVSYAQLLGLFSRVTHVDTSYSVSPCLQKLAKQGSFKPYSSAFTGITFTSYSSGTAPVPANQIPFGASYASTPLERLKWIKFLSLFTNSEPRATSVYNWIRGNYTCTRSKAIKTMTRPVVGWISYFSGTWTFTNPQYKKSYVADAGAILFFTPTSFVMSKPADVTAFYNTLKGLDVVIDESYAPVPSAYTITTFYTNSKITAGDRSLKFIAKPNVWRLDRRVNPAPNYGIDWFEGAMTQAHVVLREIANMVHPELKLGGGNFFFHNIAKGQGVVTVSSANCPILPYKATNPVPLPC